jgi:unsaturated rhamnogalacturonyl hydrolase
MLGCSSETSKKIAPDSFWSVKMVESVIKRNPEPWMIDFREKPKWEYNI